MFPTVNIAQLGIDRNRNETGTKIPTVRLQKSFWFVQVQFGPSIAPEQTNDDGINKNDGVNNCNGVNNDDGVKNALLCCCQVASA